MTPSAAMALDQGRGALALQRQVGKPALRAAASNKPNDSKTCSSTRLSRSTRPTRAPLTCSRNRKSENDRMDNGGAE